MARAERVDSDGRNLATVLCCKESARCPHSMLTTVCGDTDYMCSVVQSLAECGPRTP